MPSSQHYLLATLLLTLLLITLCCPGVKSADAYDILKGKELKGCRARVPICCPGKNNTCLVTGPRLANLNSSSCFCDEACVELGDCCLDYAVACPVQDCLLGAEWSSWNSCSTRCGAGVKERIREVIKRPRNGGMPCPPHVQKAFCDGNKCKPARTGDRSHNEMKEQARLISARFASHRVSKQYDPLKDIRKNLFEQQNLTQHSTYCAYYRITDSHHSCKLANSWTKVLIRGASVCTECQNLSMKKELGGRCLGHGVYGKVTEWKAMMRTGCHGKWILSSRHRQHCTCDQNNDFSFVFV